jgi:hypothetical protein
MRRLIHQSMDLELIEFVFKFGKFLAFTPYSCNDRQPNCLQRCHCFLVFATYTVGVAIYQYIHAWEYPTMTFIQCILMVVSYSNHYFSNFHILVVMMGLKKKRWFTLIDGLKSIKIAPVNSRQFIVLKLSVFMFLVPSTIQIFVTFYYLDYVLLFMFVPIHTYIHSQFTYSICTCVVLRMLLTRYQHYTKILLQISTSSNQINPQELSRVLKEIKRGVFVLKSCVEVFVTIFGWTILGTIFCGTFKFFYYIDFSIKKRHTFKAIFRILPHKLHFLSDLGLLAILWVQLPDFPSALQSTLCFRAVS